MKLEGAGFAEVLDDAQRLGYAEAEPSLDIDGHDAAHKIGILASLAHGFWVNPKDIHVEGIRHIDRLDMQFADLLGYTIKLLGIVKTIPDDKSKSRTRDVPARARSQRAIQSQIQNLKSKIQVSVYPTLVPNAHVLASVNGVYNAISVRGDVVGDTLYYGRGAGQDATASAVLSDLADAALDLKTGTKSRIPPFVPHALDGAVRPLDAVVCQYYVRLSVVDRPGTLAQIAAVLAEAGIGISSVIQPEGHEGESVPLILMIHDATNAAMRAVLQRIRQLVVVRGKPILLRVESFE
jgi:homoserine dehydrogenase